MKSSILWLNWRDIKNPDAGGAEVFTHEVAKRLVQRGWSVTLFASRFAGSESEEELDGVEIVRQGGRLTVYHKAKSYCGKFVDDFSAVVDEINTRPFMTPRFIRSRPIVALIHQLAREYWFYETVWPLSWLGFNFLEKNWLKQYRKIKTITVSKSTAADLRSWGFVDVCVVPEGVSVPIAKVVPSKERDPTVLFVGRLKRVKKPDHAIQAFRLIREKLPSAKLWMVGDGYLRKKIQRNPCSGVTFYGRVMDQDKIELMSRAHVLLFPAIREGWGLTITEANARGTPAVAYAVPGVRDAIVSGETGLLVGRDDWQAMAQECISLLNDSTRRAGFANRALEFARKFSWEETTSQFALHVQSAMAGK